MQHPDARTSCLTPTAHCLPPCYFPAAGSGWVHCSGAVGSAAWRGPVLAGRAAWPASGTSWTRLTLRCLWSSPSTGTPQRCSASSCHHHLLRPASPSKRSLLPHGPAPPPSRVSRVRRVDASLRSVCAARWCGRTLGTGECDRNRAVNPRTSTTNRKLHSTLRPSTRRTSSPGPSPKGTTIPGYLNRLRPPQVEKHRADPGEGKNKRRWQRPRAEWRRAL